MEHLHLPDDFREFLRLLNEHGVEYLLVGGYAVGLHGYVRATNDLDIWIAMNASNAARMVKLLHAFGFEVPELNDALFRKDDQIVRMGVPPHRIEIMTTIDGVDFEKCHKRATSLDLGGVRVSVIGLEDLKANKRASGRHKDLDDLENLP